MKRKYLFLLIIPILVLALFAALVPFEAGQGEIAVAIGEDGTLLPADELDNTVLDFLNEEFSSHTNSIAYAVGSLHWVRYQTLLGQDKGTYYVLPLVTLNPYDATVYGSFPWSTNIDLLCAQMKGGQLQPAGDMVQLFDVSGALRARGNVDFSPYDEDLNMLPEEGLDVNVEDRQATWSFPESTHSSESFVLEVDTMDRDVSAGDTVIVTATWDVTAKVRSSEIDCGETTVFCAYQTAHRS